LGCASILISLRLFTNKVCNAIAAIFNSTVLDYTGPDPRVSRHRDLRRRLDPWAANVTKQVIKVVESMRTIKECG
jgi:hypothetical protein